LLKLPKMKFNFKNLIKIGIFPLVVYLLNDIFCRFWFGFYVDHGVDSYFHFVGGVSIAFAALEAFKVLEENNFIEIKRKLVKAFLVISIVALAAVLWEIYEFILDLISHTNAHQPSLFDTMKDMILGLIGGTIYSSLNFLRSESTDGARERNTLPDVLGTANPTYDTLKPDSETRMRN
jgi:hypothetical protein